MQMGLLVLSQFAIFPCRHGGTAYKKDAKLLFISRVGGTLHTPTGW